ncbi:MAG: SIS domain-containing protein [Phycisphaerae bacterium]|nr:SIS domain-containing protein [Phycisphaerae bacterium]
MKDTIRKRFEESLGIIRLTEERLVSRIAKAVETIVQVYKAGGGVFLFGNGGSAADAQHIAGELVGRFLKERRALKAEALSTNTSVLTSLANDYAVETIFARQLEANAQPGDVAIALSTSGNSPNVLAALAKAREIGMSTIAFTGSGGGRCAELADVLLDVPASTTPRIQEAHAVIYHIICELVEAAFV